MPGVLETRKAEPHHTAVVTARWGFCNSAMRKTASVQIADPNEKSENPPARGAILRSPAELASRVRAVLAAALVAPRLRDYCVVRERLADLAEAATQQWTGRFNPRAIDRAGFMANYEAAF